MDEFGNPDDFKRQQITHQQKEEIFQKKFWNDFHRKRGLTKIRPLAERQGDEEEELTAGQKKIEELILKREADEESSRTNFDKLQQDIAQRQN